MMHIKEPLLLIGKSSLCGLSGFHLSLSEWSFTTCLTPYNLKRNVLSATLNKIFPSFTSFTMKRQTLLQCLLHWICLVPRLVYPIMILNIVSTNISFPLGKMTGTVRSWTSFINHYFKLSVDFSLCVENWMKESFMISPYPVLAEEPAKAGTCVRDRRALQQLALNVHVKHSDLTWSPYKNYVTHMVFI